MPARPTSKGVLNLTADADRVDAARRQLLADWCRLVGRRLGGDVARIDPTPSDRPGGDFGPISAKSGAATVGERVAELNLPPRLTQILTGLLAGASEKQLARTLSISPHTVHAHVKQLHKRLNVSSRGELLARFVGTAT